MQPHDTIPLKLCPDCSLLLPATSEYFARDKSKPDGWLRVCKACHNTRTRYLRVTLEERRAAYDPTIRQCTRCQQTFPAALEFFYAARNNGPDALLAICKDCVAASNRESRIRDPQKHREWNRKYTAANRDKRRKSNRDWRTRNLESQRERERLVKSKDPNRREKVRQWRLSNRDRARQNIRKYMTRKAGHGVNYTNQDWQFAVSYFGGSCAVCGRAPGLWHNLAMDHWIPNSNPDCPGTIPANIIPLCNGADGS